MPLNPGKPYMPYISDLKISIIIPIYNTECYLRRCLDSIIHQTYRNLEIILVDDGSTDESGAICDEYREKDDRVVVIHNKNAGASAARNAGLDAASGRFISFVDSDDWVELDMYEMLADVYAQTKADIVQCDFYYADDIGYTRRFSYDIAYNKGGYLLLFPEQAVEFLLQDDNLVINNGLYPRIYTRELFNDIRLPVDILIEDRCVVYKLILKSSCIAKVPAAKYYYYRRPHSICQTSSLSLYLNWYRAELNRYNGLQDCESIHKRIIVLSLGLVVDSALKVLERADCWRLGVKERLAIVGFMRENKADIVSSERIKLPVKYRMLLMLPKHLFLPAGAIILLFSKACLVSRKTIKTIIHPLND